MHPIPDTPRPRTRWWQFRLRTLLLVLTLAGAGSALMGIPLAEYYRERQIVAPIEAAGGRVTRQFVPRAGSSVLQIVIGSHAYTRVDSIEYASGTRMENLSQLHELHHLTSLTARGAALSDEHMAAIRRISGLKSLDISTSTITDSALLRLRGHPQLSRLNVARTAISDAAVEQLEATLPQADHLLRQRAVDELLAAGWTLEPLDDPLAGNFSAASLRNQTNADDLRQLKRLPGLTSLTLVDASLTDECLDRIGEVTDLDTLHVSSGELPAGGFARLKTLSKLRSLRLQWMPVEDEGLSHFGEFPELRELWLDRTEVTGLGLAHLHSLGNLQDLNLGGVQRIYDVDLEALYPLKNLRTLTIPDARVTPAGIALLKRAKPGINLTLPKEPGISEGPPADTDRATHAAFWAGRYDQLQQCLEATDNKRDWNKRMWLGHARQLSGDWPGAVQAYKEAIDLLGQAWAGSSDVRQREGLAAQWLLLVLMTGRAQLDVLDDPAAATETLKDGLRFAPAADRPAPILAQEAAKRIDGLSNPHSTREGTGQLWSELMYPLATQRHLATAHERSGNEAAALECWTRIRLCSLAYRAAMAETDPLHLAELWASLRNQEPLPALPVFSVIAGGEQAITLKPDSGSSRLTCWDANAWNSFGLVPKPGHAIASITFECDANEERGESTLSCWAGDINRHGQGCRVLLDETPVAAGDSPDADGELAVSVVVDEDLLFVNTKNITSVTIRATLRPRSGTNEDPEREQPAPRLLSFEDFLVEVGPFRCVDQLPREPINQRLGASAVARLPDGRFILACGDDAIEIALSEDGKTWEGPFPYPHNEIFPTRNPALCRADDGLVWMVYLSKRPSYDNFASAPYYLYCTSTRDGRNWSRPKPIRPTRGIQYQEVPRLLRDLRGDIRLFLGDSGVVAASPDEFGPMQPLHIPIREDWSPRDADAAWDDRGRCHLIYSDAHGRLHYSYADSDGIWRVDTRLADIESEHVNTPQLILDGERLALLYWISSGLWLHRGHLAEDGPRFGPAQQITNHRMSARGAQWMRDGDDVYLPIPARPPLLLQARLDDLLQAD